MSINYTPQIPTRSPDDLAPHFFPVEDGGDDMDRRLSSISGEHDMMFRQKGKAAHQWDRLLVAAEAFGRRVDFVCDHLSWNLVSGSDVCLW